MSYYKEHAREYIESTMDSDMSEEYALFEPSLPKGGSILDVGFGSGRDMLYFTKQGYRVLGIDQEPQFVEHALSMGLSAEQEDVLTFQTTERYDGIWACASLLHLKEEKLHLAIHRLLTLLKPTGVLYLSMKYGEGYSLDELGRPLLRVNEKTFEPYFVRLIHRSIEKDRGIEWISVILHS